MNASIFTDIIEKYFYLLWRKNFIPSAHCPFAAAFSWTLTANCPVYELKAPACIAAACWLAAEMAAAFDAADATCDLKNGK